MKLFLSSIRLPNKDEQAKLFGDKKHVSVVVIPNAWDTYPEDKQKAELTNTISNFKDLGYQPTILDLVASSDKLRRDSVLTSDFVWFTGGNSFYLNYQVQKAGFDTLLKEALDKGIVYGGTSAGAVIACPTLHGVENADNPNDAPQVIWGGLKLVDFGIVPHWGMEKYADKLEKMADEMRPYVSQLVTLTNEQAAIVIDGVLEVAGTLLTS